MHRKKYSYSNINCAEWWIPAKRCRISIVRYSGSQTRDAGTEIRGDLPPPNLTPADNRKLTLVFLCFSRTQRNKCNICYWISEPVWTLSLSAFFSLENNRITSARNEISHAWKYLIKFIKTIAAIHNNLTEKPVTVHSINLRCASYKWPNTCTLEIALWEYVTPVKVN